MKFTGSIEELKEKLSSLVTDKFAWRQLDNDHYRLKHSSGSSVDFYPSKEMIRFEGNWRFRKMLKGMVQDLLTPGENDSSVFDDTTLVPEISSPAIPAALSYTQVKTESSVELKRPPEKEYITDLDSEIVIGLVSTVGTDTDAVTRVIKDRLSQFDYTTQEIRISRDILSDFVDTTNLNAYQRIDALMTMGNTLRQKTGDCAFLAKAAVAKINAIRVSRSQNFELPPLRRKAFVVTSLKHPDEVQALRKIYSNGFFLIGIHASEERRMTYLVQEKEIESENAKALVDRDAKDRDDWGQQTRDTFHLSDFFISFEGDLDKFNNDIWRTIDLIFGQPFVTPTFDEFAMFMAFSASLRSADLSRQVGAVVTRENNILSTGANDVPSPGGGLYWPEPTPDGKRIIDQPDGRDYVRGGDANVLERLSIIDGIVEKFSPEHQDMAREILNASRLKDLTEYGRVVHAEMEALLACARNSISTKGTQLYCTTFPCHNCAKHIIASGVRRVVYVEPYAKSKALDFHSDSILMGKHTDLDDKRVSFEAFVGVGPRSFFNLFSTNLGSGYKITRKGSNGKKIIWEKRTAKVRMQMLPSSYIEREAVTAIEYKESLEKLS